VLTGERVLSDLDDDSEPGVQEIMAASVLTVDATATVKDAAVLMSKKAYGCVLVVEGHRAIGIITERDIVRQIAAEGVDPSKVRAADVMSTPLVTIPVESTIMEAAERMSTYGIRRIVVVNDDGALAGLLTAGDLAKWLAKQKNYTDSALNAIARLKRIGTGGPYG
jgi:CBS domain-containing protein